MLNLKRKKYVKTYYYSLVVIFLNAFICLGCTHNGIKSNIGMHSVLTHVYQYLDNKDKKALHQLSKQVAQAVKNAHCIKSLHFRSKDNMEDFVSCIKNNELQLINPQDITKLSLRQRITFNISKSASINLQIIRDMHLDNIEAIDLRGIHCCYLDSLVQLNNLSDIDLTNTTLYEIIHYYTNVYDDKCKTLEKRRYHFKLADRTLAEGIRYCYAIFKNTDIKIKIGPQKCDAKNLLLVLQR